MEVPKSGEILIFFGYGRGMRFLILLALIAAGLVALADSIVTKPSRPATGAFTMTLHPLVLDSADPARTQAGDLHYLGGWEVKGRPKLFGGLSSLLIRPDGKIWALSDGGVMFEIPPTISSGFGYATVLKTAKPPKKWMPTPTDSESMVVDPQFKHLWVGYELLQRICRYTTDLAQAGTCKDWPELQKWPEAESLESMTRLPDGRFLMISEGAQTGKGGRDALLFEGDPVDPSTGHPVHLTYIPPTGYNPTDSVWIGDNQLLVLNRRATLYDGFTAIIELVDISALKAGATLRGREIARLAPPLLSDNFEGMAVERKDGQRIFWIVSDDNHLFLQRTLLLKFALPDNF